MENKNTILALILSGLFAILGTILGGIVQGYWNVKLAEQKYQSDLILKALESNSAKDRLETLNLLVHTNLIKQSDVRDSVTNYIKKNKNTPESIPQVKSSLSLDPPIVDNARVYLLAGNKNKTTSFNDLSLKLKTAGYKLMGANTIVDLGRPDNVEVRFFNLNDQSQAEKIAEFMRFSANNKDFAAKYYQDPKAKPGYIEIWLGR